FAAQYQLTLTEEVEVRYRTETRTDSEGNEYDVEVPYNYYILNVTLTSKPISSVALELLTPDQLEMYQVYRQDRKSTRLNSSHVFPYTTLFRSFSRPNTS